MLSGEPILRFYLRKDYEKYHKRGTNQAMKVERKIEKHLLRELEMASWKN